jgi:hypothetical protein
MLVAFGLTWLLREIPLRQASGQTLALAQDGDDVAGGELEVALAG